MTPSQLRFVLALSLALAACPSDDGGTTNADSSSSSSGTTDVTTTMTSSPTTTMSTTDVTSETMSTTVDPSSETTADPSTETTDPDSSSGSSTAESGSSETGSGFSVAGEVTRSAQGTIFPGDDGIGTLYVGALEACDQKAASGGGVSVEMADFSETDTPVPYVIDNLPNGTWYIAGFLDDDENADPKDPSADMGDIAYAMGFGPGCVEVTIDNADVEGADFALNINVPF